MTIDDSLFPEKILDHGDLADLPAVGLEDADLHLNPLQRHRIGDRPFELRDVVDIRPPNPQSASWAPSGSAVGCALRVSRVGRGRYSR